MRKNASAKRLPPPLPARSRAAAAVHRMPPPCATAVHHWAPLCTTCHLHAPLLCTARSHRAQPPHAVGPDGRRCALAPTCPCAAALVAAATPSSSCAVGSKPCECVHHAASTPAARPPLHAPVTPPRPPHAPRWPYRLCALRASCRRTINHAARGRAECPATAAPPPHVGAHTRAHRTASLAARCWPDGVTALRVAANPAVLAPRALCTAAASQSGAR